MYGVVSGRASTGNAARGADTPDLLRRENERDEHGDERADANGADEYRPIHGIPRPRREPHVAGNRVAGIRRSSVPCSESLIAEERTAS